jgi:hypothetical protein
MSILFLVVEKQSSKMVPKTISAKTKESLDKIIQKGDEVIFKTTDEYELFYQFKPKKNFDYVCVIPNNGEVNENFPKILNDYQEKREEQIAFLPLVVLTSPKTKGVLNTCVWNNNIADEPGVLTPDLAKLQIDTTLFGAVIPFDLFFNEENYNKELKHYQHFYFFNKITTDENNIVFGIPKTLLFTDVDLSFVDISNEEKMKYFKQAKEINAPTA